MKKLQKNKHKPKTWKEFQGMYTFLLIIKFR